jgi:hypothetical protein
MFGAHLFLCTFHRQAHSLIKGMDSMILSPKYKQKPQLGSSHPIVSFTIFLLCFSDADGLWV